MNQPMRDHLFLALTRYLVAEDVILEHLVEHRAWTKRAFDEGTMLFTGRQDPPTGGVMCFRAEDRQSAEDFVREDPFVQAALVEWSVVSITPTQFPWRSEALDQFLGGVDLAQRT